MKNVFAFFLAVSALGLGATPFARATETIDLTTDHMTVNNQPNEDVVVHRLATTPNKIKLQMNPHTEYVNTCTQTDYRQVCGWNAIACGTDPIQFCGRRGCFWDYRPRYCCTQQPYCSRYEPQPVNKYEEFEIKFKDNLLDSADVDTIQLVPVAPHKIQLNVLSSKRPYRIKSNGDQNKFELRQK